MRTNSNLNDSGNSLQFDTSKSGMNAEERNYYINKFRMKMAGSLPSVAAEWIEGCNRGTNRDRAMIYDAIRNDLDWVAKDPQRMAGNMPTWTRTRSLKGHTFNSQGKKVQVTIPAREEELTDDNNPAYLYNTVNTSILVQIANGEIDANYIARVELANRGLDKKGNWVGFKAAARIHNIL